MQRVAWLLLGCCINMVAQFNPAPEISLYDKPPNTIARTEGEHSAAAYRIGPDARAILSQASGKVLARLPAVQRKAAPSLLGVLRGGAQVELFLGWVDPASEPGNFAHHIEVFRGSALQEYALVHDFVLYGGPNFSISFFNGTEVFIDIQGGSYWGTTYLLSPDVQSATKLFESSDYDVADLNHNGQHQIIAWNRRPFDVRCNFGIFAVRFYPEVFVKAGSSYRKAWPPEGWAVPVERAALKPDKEVQVSAGFADLEGNGRAGLIVLEDRTGDVPRQKLSVYRLTGAAFQLITQTALSRRIAFLVWGAQNSSRGKEIVVWAATPERCRDGGNPEGPGTARVRYVFEGGRLVRVQ